MVKIFSSDIVIVLQWSRVPANSETSKKHPKTTPKSPASMEPSSCELGNAVFVVHDLGFVAASMEPSSCELGNAMSRFSTALKVAIASMEPSSCELGNPPLELRRNRQFSASMEPSSCELGNKALQTRPHETT